MSKEAWFAEDERLIDSGAPHSTETADAVMEKIRERMMQNADILKKRERGE
jgi:hypothetical protein